MSEEYERKTDRIASALGWASIGLGMVQLAAPGPITRLSGVDDSPLARGLVRFVGVRELFHAMVLLGSRRPAPWVWTRVAGDAMDLTTLGWAIANREGWRRRRVTAVTAAVAGLTAVDLYTAMRANRRRRGIQAPSVMSLHAAITVYRPRQEVYDFWHDFENLPRFMAHLESVETIGGGYSHWRASAPAGRCIEWDAEIVEDRPGELIAWRSTESAAVRNRGSVSFTDAPGGRGTEVRVEIEYDPPGGKVGLAFARLLGEHPEQQVRDDLRRFKQVMETGEVVRSEGSPEGIRALRQVMQRPAQPVR
ncbi:SRPBCC family protein [Sphaerisporangium sp. NPDC088356]|uniref:SRPBCC family protein n=1 Tax=Sphaerisporangium sp. NPDC088356 TaxID=3154871 RepID=UPI003429419F